MISKQKVRLFLRLSISTIIIGILFKIMHWPYSAIIVITGAFGITIFYSLKFYQKKPKQLLDYSRLFLLISFLLHYLFRIFHLSYGYVFTTITQFAFVVFLILYVREVFFIQTDVTENDAPITKINTRQKAVSYLLYGIAAIGIIVGAQFKILHWEFGLINGNVMLTAGLLAAAASVFISSSDPKS